MSYSHERTRPKSDTFNTLWPTVATDDYANHWYREYLRQRRIDFETAYLTGVYPSNMDCLRAVLPCVSRKEGHAYYQARAIPSHATVRYRSPMGARHGALFCADSVSESSPFLCLVEGPMDALALASCGVDSIALMGISPDEETRHHVIHRLKVNPRPVVIMFDNEDEAQSKASELALYLASYGFPSRVFIPKSKDFAASSDSERRTYVKEFTAWANRQRLSTRSSGPHQKTPV